MCIKGISTIITVSKINHILQTGYEKKFENIF